MVNNPKISAKDFLNGKTEQSRAETIGTSLNIGLAFTAAGFGTYFSQDFISEKAREAWSVLNQFGIDALISSANFETVAQLASIAGAAFCFCYIEKIGSPIYTRLLNEIQGRTYFRDDIESVRQLKWEDLIDGVGIMSGKSNILNAVEQTLVLLDAPFSRHDVDDSGVIFCRKSDLRKALNLVLATMQGEKPLKQFTIIHDGNFGMPGEAAPACFHVREDGSVVAVWANKEGMPTFSISYSANGIPMQVAELMGSRYSVVENPAFKVPSLTETAGAMGLAIGERQKAIENAWERLRMDRNTHKVTPTDDGGVIVRSRKTNKVDNPHGPAVILPDGRELYFQDGRKSEARYPSVDADLVGLGVRPAF